MIEQLNECKNCLHFSKKIEAGANRGFCMYNPPTTFVVPTSLNGIAVQSVFPSVSYSDRCSKFADRSKF